MYRVIINVQDKHFIYKVDIVYVIVVLSSNIEMMKIWGIADMLSWDIYMLIAWFSVNICKLSD